MDYSENVLRAAAREAVHLWVFTPSKQWNTSLELVQLGDHLVRVGYTGVLDRWRFVQPVARDARVWARARLIPRDLRVRRTTEGEIARALWGFYRWHSTAVHLSTNQHHHCAALSIHVAFLPLCRNCGTLAGRWCSSCNLHSRVSQWQNAVCSTRDGPTEEPCVHCLRNKHGQILKL